MSFVVTSSIFFHGQAFVVVEIARHVHYTRGVWTLAAFGAGRMACLSTQG